MNTRDDLEHGLETLTAWRGPPLHLWERALAQSASSEPPSPTPPLLGRRIRHPFAVAALLAIVASVLLLASLPDLGRARSTRHSVDAGPPPASEPAPFYGYPGMPVASAAPSPQQPQSSSGGAIERQVIRKATVEIAAEDVHAAFAKAGHIVSLARGEFVQESSISGEGPAHATLTLRIAADRLSEVLNELRTLGTVTSERSSGEDVTAQVVDLEARLHNEQRIEAELLELLDRRADAPLKEILELRESISRVRQTIEHLQGQRQHLSRMVSLATVLVILRGAEEPQISGGIGEYFLETIGSAWTSGLRLLADAAGFLVRIAVGGLFWWILLSVLLLALHRWHSRRLARGV